MFINAKFDKRIKWEFIEPLLCDQNFDEHFHACFSPNPLQSGVIILSFTGGD